MDHLAAGMFRQQDLEECMNSILILVKGLHIFLSPWMNIQKTNQGQSLIEFIMTLSFSLGIVFLFFSIAFNATDGYIAHYATFMASRTYLVVDVNANRPNGSDAIAQSEAQRVFTKYLNPSKGKFYINSPDSIDGLPYVGAGFEFKQKFSFGMIGVKDDMNLNSESFLGREPTRAECAERICYAFHGAGGGCESLVHFTLYDNGC